MQTDLIEAANTKAVEAQQTRLAELEVKRGKLCSRLERLAGIRRQNAIAAAQGSKRAREEIQKTHAEGELLDRTLDDLDLAIGEAKRGLADAEHSVLEAEHQRKAQELWAIVETRRAIAADVQKSTLDLIQGFRALRESDARIRELHNELFPIEEGAIVDRPYAFAETFFRYKRWAVGQGLGEYLKLGVDRLGSLPADFVHDDIDNMRLIKLADKYDEARWSRLRGPSRDTPITYRTDERGNLVVDEADGSAAVSSTDDLHAERASSSRGAIDHSKLNLPDDGLDREGKEHPGAGRPDPEVRSEATQSSAPNKAVDLSHLNRDAAPTPARLGSGGKESSHSA